MPLHALMEADLELILPWRNAPTVRQAMYSHHEISLDEHRAWFRRLHHDPTRRWYLYRDTVDAPQGVVYFTDLHPEHDCAFWGFYARPEAPAGTGLCILYCALEHAFGVLALHKLNGEVLANNNRSINLHKKVGFTEEGRFRQQHFDGETRIDVIRLGLLASEWPAHRERLTARIFQPDTLGTC